jgi:hypothetical protein
VSPEDTQEQRRKDRNQLIGDILWSYATDPPFPQYEGTLIDISKGGIGMLSDRPVREASVVKIYGKKLWQGARYATVMWCEEASPGAYRSGLLFTGTAVPF